MPYLSSDILKTGPLMNRLTVHCFDSAGALRSAAPAWDDLWQRSAVTVPSAQAELLLQWFEHFAPRARTRILAVEQGGRFMAGLPLVEGRAGRLLRIGKSPGNDWFPSADLLADRSADAAVFDALVAALEGLGWPLVLFDAVDLESPRWQAFTDSLARLGNPWVSRDRFRIGIADIGRNWPDCQANWSSNHRRHMRKSAARAIRQGALELKVYDQLPPEAVEALLQRGFEIEDSSWKGTRGSSVLKSPGIFEFYLRQARELAARGQLQLVFLESAGRPIAFEYGWNAKGVYHSLKVGYDAAAADLSPGQLLRLCLLERLHAEGRHRWLDFLGPLTPAIEKWSTRSYVLSRLVVATHSRLGRLMLEAYQWSTGLRRQAAEPLGAPAASPAVGVAVPLAARID